MKFIPKTFYIRTVFLVVALIITSFIASYFIFLYFYTKPMAESVSDYVSEHINSVHHALQNMDEIQQKNYLKQLQNDKHIFLAKENTVPGREPELFYEPPFKAAMLTRLNKTALDVRFEMDGVMDFANPRIIWVKVLVKDKPIWLGSHLGFWNEPFPEYHITLLSFILLLTGVGAYLIARRVKQPLNQLVNAAEQLGKGVAPEPIQVKGPIELQTMGNAFNQMAEDIQKLSDDRNLMLAGISHDLRTPLARVRLALDMIDEQITEDLYSGMVQDIEDIDKIVGQFLTFVRDGVDEPYSYENINDTIEYVVSRYIKDGKDIKFVEGDIPKCMFKPIAIQRLLMNLIDNAWHYGKKDVEVHTTVVDNKVKISVLDRGPGIDTEHIERLKQPFTRMDESRGGTKGAGLGLAIVVKIAEWHGGEVDIKQREGGGLIVDILLPINFQA